MPQKKPQSQEAAPVARTSISTYALRLLLIIIIGGIAYDIRLFAIREYGLVIHEFDPWFNFRATQYLADNGLTKFFHWFDYMSWYPLGRPVGSTIYPGMQIVSVIIWKVLNAGGIAMSLNDVCCYVPAWFGVIATYFLGLLAYECTKSVNTAIFAAAIMAIIPAHLMRSIGGGFDNEAVAMTAMMMTFYFYCLSLREGGRLWFVGIFAGFAYGFMAATWGGYVFVINMVGLHAGVLALVRYSSKLHRAYTLFYIVGTFLATRVPVISMTPLKSLEQMMPLLVFFCAAAVRVG